MCGRFAFWNDRNKILQHFGLTAAPDIQHSYNITPDSSITILRVHQDRELVNCRWGFIPHWARDTQRRPINARAETLTVKPFFRESFKRRRCLIPASGFYEWRGTKGHKQPYFIKPRATELFAFAGLWDHWDSPLQSLDTCAIITTGANDAMRPIHDRMPVIIDPENYAAWLEQGGTELLVPYLGALEIYPVSPWVNNPENQGPDLVQPAA